MLKVLSIFLRLFWTLICFAIVILTPTEDDDSEFSLRYGRRVSKFEVIKDRW